MLNIASVQRNFWINSRKKTIEKVIFVIFVISYRLLLDWSYVNVISQKYAYANFVNNTNSTWQVFSWILLAIFTIMIKDYYMEVREISDEIFFVLYIASIVPFTTMVGYGQFSMEYAICNSLYWFILLIAQKYVGRRQKIKFKIGQQKFRNLNQLLIFIAIVSFIIVFYISGRYAGFRINFNISADVIYDFRQQARLNNLPRLLRYAFSWTQTIIPILIAYFITKKNVPMVIICLLTTVLSFGYDGSKMPFFMSLVAVFFNLVRKIDIKKINRWIFLLIVGVCGIGVLEYVGFQTYSLEGIFIRRGLFLPNLVSSYYFDFFTSHTPDYFRSGVLSGVFNGGPYPELQYTIGSTYTNLNQWMNNGLISDAVTNLGIPGVFILPWILVFVLRVLDRCAEGIDMRIYITSSILLAFTLLNSFLSVVLVSHGMIVVMVLLFIMKKYSEEKRLIGTRNLKVYLE